MVSMARLLLAAVCALLAGWHLQAQELVAPPPGQRLRFHPTDSAVLAGSENRDDLDCRVEPLQPRLDFDLKYTAGYVVHLPAEAVVAGGENLRVLFRIRPMLGEPSDPVYFRQSFDVAPGSAEGGGTALFQGRFFLGPGRYSVDWLMRNLAGRVCSSHWTVRAPKPGYDGRMAASAAPHLIAAYREDTFDEEPPVARSADPSAGLHVRLLLNLAPLDRHRFKLSEYEIDSIVGMLRSLHREPSLGMFSLTAFNSYDRQVVYSAIRSTKLDFPAIGRAIDEMEVGTVDVEELADSEGEERFLAELLNEALAPEAAPPDAVVVLGPKVDREGRIPEDMLSFQAASSPLFRFVFNVNPRSYPWPGALEMALQPFGLTVFGVTRPQDFTRAVAGLLDVIERNAKYGLSPGRRPAGTESPPTSP